MRGSEFKNTALDTFLRYVNNSEIFKNKTLCYFHPFNSKGAKHITVADPVTTFSILIPFSVDAISLLNKQTLEEIFHKTLQGLYLAMEKHKDVQINRDFKQKPAIAGKKQSKFVEVFSNEKITVEIFEWSEILEETLLPQTDLPPYSNN